MATNGSFTGTTANEQIVPKIVWSAAQSFDTNTSTITATLYYSRTNSSGDKTSGWWDGSLTIDGNTKTVENNKITISYNSNTVAITHTVTVEHELDGSKTLTISATGAIPSTSLSSTTISATVTLDAFNRLSTLTAENGTLGTAQVLKVTKQADSFTHTITYSCGNLSGTVCTKNSSTSVSWTPPLDLATQNTTGANLSVTLKIDTYIGETNIGTYSYTIACAIPASVKPSCSIAVSDLNGYADSYAGYIQGYSRFKIVTTPTMAYGAEIVSTSVLADGVTYNGSTVETNPVNGTGTLTITATVTDTRGRTGTTSANVTVLEYDAPAIATFKIKRCDSNGTENDQGAYVQVTFSAQVTWHGGRNSAAYKLEYKKTASSSYTAIDMSAYAGQYFVSNGTKIFAADTGSSYNVRLTVSDKFVSTVKTAVASTASTLMHWPTNGLGMAIGKVAELTNTLDIAFETKFSGGILPIQLPSGTNLNDITTPNFYSGYWIPDNVYPNAPVTDGHFSLDVTASHDGKIIYQRFTAFNGIYKTFLRVRMETGQWYPWHNIEESIKADVQAEISSMAEKTYADGYVYVDFGELPATTASKTFVLPSGVTEYWIDKAWTEYNGKRYFFSTYLFDACVHDGNTLTVDTLGDVSGYSGHFVIAYKK